MKWILVNTRALEGSSTTVGDARLSCDILRLPGTTIPVHAVLSKISRNFAFQKVRL